MESTQTHVAGESAANETYAKASYRYACAEARYMYACVGSRYSAQARKELREERDAAKVAVEAAHDAALAART